MPDNIISDRDPTFLSEIWGELFRVHGVDLRFSTAYHPQTDGQTEITNQTLETYLRCMASDAPHTWAKWLPLAEWWYNITYHSSVRITPFEVVYDQPPPIHLPYLPGESPCVTIDRSIQKRETIISALKFHLSRAQNRMKQLADRQRSECAFAVGDSIYLNLQPYRQQSLKTSTLHKLAPKFYGPFWILDKIGVVSYKLELPSSTKIHNVFHVSQLKRCYNNPSKPSPLPQFPSDVRKSLETEAILDRKMAKRRNEAITSAMEGSPRRTSHLGVLQGFHYQVP